MGASVTLGAPVVSVEPGGHASLEVRLRNTGAVVDEFTLDVIGDAAGWAAVEPPTMSLFPGAEETARVVFNPPRSSAVVAGQQPFGVRARSSQDPEGSSVEEATVDVLPFQDPFAELVPRASRGSRTARHEVALDNRGNVRVNAELEATDADRLLSFDIDPPSLVVDPGMAGFANVKVRPTQRFWRGTPKSRPFQLYVRPEGAGPMTLDGSMLQESMLPPWFMRALIAALVLLAAAVLLWFLVLRPSIQSAATEAVASPLAELRGDINDTLGGAGMPTLGPAGASSAPPAGPTPTTSPSGGSAPPTVSPSPAGPVVPGFGELVSGRMTRGDSFTSDGTLLITDMLLSNPNGREGTMVLTRDGEIVYQWALVNFRDLDFHLVAPIVVGPGQAVALDINCTGVPAADCDPSLLYSGYKRP